MSLIKPAGKLLHFDAARKGCLEELGYGRTWRANWEWETRGMEYVAPLHCVAPMGQWIPEDMTLDTWTPGLNQRFVETRVRGSKHVKWLEYYDGKVHTSGEAGSEAAGILTSISPITPRFALHTIRATPPEDQGVEVYIICMMGMEWRMTDGHWEFGFLSLLLPIADARCSMPFLHAQAPPQEGLDLEGLFTPGSNQRIIAASPYSMSSADQALTEESWIFEYEELYDDSHDPAPFVGTHIVIRNSRQLGEWWHHFAPRMRLLNSPIGIGVRGTKVWLNLTPIRYGESETVCWPYIEEPIPQGLPANTTATFSSCVRDVPGWTTATERYGTYRPKITMTRGSPTYRHERPLFWFANQVHDGVLGEGNDTYIVGHETTEGDALLTDVEITLNDQWRGAHGSAQMQAKAENVYYSWNELDEVEVYLGWQDDPTYGSRKVATQYIERAGLPRTVDAQESPKARLGVRFGDYAQVRMPHKAIYAGVEAACATVGDWFRYVCNQLGIADERVSVDANVEDLVVPWAGFPSVEAFEPLAGMLWQEHLNDVCGAMGIRWGCDKDAAGSLFVDSGRAEYEHGVSPIAWTIEAPTDRAERVWRLDHTQTQEDVANCLLVIVDGPRGREEFYSVQSYTERAPLGDDCWRVQYAESAADAAKLISMFEMASDRAANVIAWDSVLRSDLRPEEFVKVGTDYYTDITVNTVFQIAEHTMVGKGQANRGSSQFLGEIVYEP